MTCVHNELIRPDGEYETNQYVCKECKLAIKTSVLPVRRQMIQRPQQRRNQPLPRPPPPMQQQAPPPTYIVQRPPEDQERKPNIIDDIDTFFAPINNQKPMTDKFFETTYGQNKPNNKPPRPKKAKKGKGKQYDF